MGTGSLWRRSRDGRWIAQVSVGGRAERRIVRRVFRTRAEAAAGLDALRADHAVGSPDLRVTTGAYLRSWLSGAGREVLKPSTLETYEIAVRLHIAPAVGRIPLTRLAPEDVERMLAGSPR